MNLSDIFSSFGDLGWQVKIRFDRKRDQFIASATGPNKEKCETFGKDEKQAVFNLFQNVLKLTVLHQRNSHFKSGAWSLPFLHLKEDIAKAYEKAPIYEPKAAIAFMDLAYDAKHRYDVLKNTIDISFVNDPHPYHNARDMCEDVRKHEKLKVSKAGSHHHPLWSTDDVMKFRAAFDILGYCAADVSNWGWEATNLAFSQYVPLLNAGAQMALFSEVLAPLAFGSYYRSYGPQKIVLFPEFMEPAQESENPGKVYHGIHPTQSKPPMDVPTYKSASVEDEPDPNHNWQSGIEPPPDNAYVRFDPLGYGGGAGPAVHVARLLDTKWYLLNRMYPGEVHKMKQAIVNAFRAAILSPRNSLFSNMVHYQGIAHMPIDEDRPLEFYRNIQKARADWYARVYGEPFRYRPYKFWEDFSKLESVLQSYHPDEDAEQIRNRAERILLEIRTNVEEHVLSEDEAADPIDVEKKVDERIGPAIGAYIKDRLEEADRPRKAAGINHQSVSGVVGNTIRALAQIQEHTDELLKAALADVDEDNGRGYIFRAAVMKMNLAGVGPKVCSFAWLLLRPMTSELATIDTHIFKLLKQKEQKELSNRDYFLMERMLRGALDHAGYQNMPLGMAQWAAWDAQRTGIGTHQDHSALRPIEPTHWSEVHFHPLAKSNTLLEMPFWHEASQAVQPLRDQWNKIIESHPRDFPQKKVPFGIHRYSV